MCLAIPGRIIALSGQKATVDFSGVQKEALMDLLPEAQVGDYVLVHAGFAIQKLEKAEAQEMLSLLREMEKDENGPSR